MQKRVALVGYSSDVFIPFARALERDGFAVFWITGLKSHAHRLRATGVPAERILEVVEGDGAMTDEEATRILAALERDDDDAPMVNDIIAMDRILRRRPHSEARRYLATAAREMSRFLAEHEIRLVSSGRDTAFQMVSMLVSRKSGRLWVVPTRTRLPRERYGFQSTHHLERYVKLRDVTAADRSAAESYLSHFRERQLVAAAKASAGSFLDVAARLPVHVRLFGQALKEAFHDRGNRRSRYTLGDLGRMYTRRRANLVDFKLHGSFEETAVAPYVLYALHTQPESSIDVSGSFYSDQIALVGQIARSVPATHRLYVKIHPSDMDGKPWSFYKRLLAIPGVSLIGPRTPSRPLLLGCSLVFSITGTIAYEAGLLGIPAITFTRLYFNRLPSVHYCPGVTDLPALVARLLEHPPKESPAERAAIVDFLAELHANSVPGDVNRIHVPLTDADLESLTAVYNRLLEIANAGTPSVSRAGAAPTLSVSA
jgi:hypothetical protein